MDCALTLPTALGDSTTGDLSSFFSNDIYVWLVLTFSSPLSDEMEESLEEKVRGGRSEGTFYKWSDDKETSGNKHYLITGNCDKQLPPPTVS